jgi:hypothetical protein
MTEPEDGSPIRCVNCGWGRRRGPVPDWWTTTDVAHFINTRVSTVSGYRRRGLLPEPDRFFGRSPVWRPAKIVWWHNHRPRLGIGGRPRMDGSVSTPMHDLPEHYPIPIDKDGNGPAEGDDVVRIACWCGDDDCERYK